MCAIGAHVKGGGLVLDRDKRDDAAGEENRDELRCEEQLDGWEGEGQGPGAQAGAEVEVRRVRGAGPAGARR